MRNYLVFLNRFGLLGCLLAVLTFCIHLFFIFFPLFLTLWRSKSILVALYVLLIKFLLLYSSSTSSFFQWPNAWFLMSIFCHMEIPTLTDSRPQKTWLNIKLYMLMKRDLWCSITNEHCYGVKKCHRKISVLNLPEIVVVIVYKMFNFSDELLFGLFFT